MEISCMPHEQHAQKILYDDTCTPWTKLFFTTDHAPRHTDYYPLCVALARAWPIDKLVAREKKIVIATSLLWCTTAQSSCCHPRTTGDGHASRDQLTSSAKNWCWQKKDGFYGCGSLLDLLDVAAPRYTHHALRTASLSGTCNKSTMLKTRCGTNVQPNFTIVAQIT